MSKDVSSIFAAHQRQLHDEHPFIWLYEFEIPEDPPRRMRLTNYTQQRPFGENSNGDPVIYYPAAIAHGGIVMSDAGDLPRFNVQVSNLSHGGPLRTDRVSDLVNEHEGLCGMPVVVRVISLADIFNASAQIRFDAEVVKPLISFDRVTFELAPTTLIAASLPAYRYTAGSCRVKRFGAPLCGYEIPTTPTNAIGGGYDFCPRTHNGCEDRGEDEAARGVDVMHPLRFGGFRGIQQRSA